MSVCGKVRAEGLRAYIYRWNARAYFSTSTFGGAGVKTTLDILLLLLQLLLLLLLLLLLMIMIIITRTITITIFIHIILRQMIIHMMLLITFMQLILINLIMLIHLSDGSAPHRVQDAVGRDTSAYTQFAV